MPFLYEQKQNRIKEPYIEITGYEGAVPHLRIPGKLEGIAVRSIGSRAFAGRKELQSVELPEGIDTLRQYAFYNCPNLERIILHDGVEDYYDGVIKQCIGLQQIEVFLHQGRYAVVRDMLADNDRKMNFILHFDKDVKDLNQNSPVCLVFPAYVYDFVEDVEARVLHHKIEGCGYAYRECVTRRGIDYRAYDQMFRSAVDDDAAEAAEIALTRLMYPYELEMQSKEQYEAYVKKHAYGLLAILIGEKKGEEQVRFLAEQELIPDSVLEQALQFTARPGKAVFGAILMDYRHKHLLKSERKPGGGAFSLEDW